MSINRKRLKEYIKEIQNVQKRTNIQYEYTLYRAKLQDFLVKNERELNSLTIHEWRREIEAMFNPHYQRWIRDIFLDFNNVVEMVNDVYEEFGADVSRDFQKIRATEAVIRSDFGQFGESAIKDMAKSIRKQLIKNDSVDELSEYLRGHTDKKIQHYANTLARTQVKGYGQELKNEQSRIAEVELFQYVRNSPLRPNSHTFCVLMHNRTCHIEDILKLKNGQLEPVITYCGGFNCVNFWEPDPFAKEKDPGDFVDKLMSGDRIIRVFIDIG